MEKKERVVFLDCIRVIACFLVLMVHASEQYYESGQDWWITRTTASGWVYGMA